MGIIKVNLHLSTEHFQSLQSEMCTSFLMPRPWPRRSCRIWAKGGCVPTGWTRWTPTARSTSYSQDISPLPKAKEHPSLKHCIRGTGRFMGWACRWPPWASRSKLLALQSLRWHFTHFFPLQTQNTESSTLKGGSGPISRDFSIHLTLVSLQEENQPCLLTHRFLC